MAVGTLIKHGTNAGYRAEIAVGEPCDRCRKAHRVFGTQYTASAKRKGIKYRSDEILDHLYKPGRQTNANRTPPNLDLRGTAEIPAEPRTEATTDANGTEPTPSIGDRLADRIRAMTIGAPNQGEYVEEQDTGYVHAIDDLDAPGSEWEPAPDSEYVITAAGLKKIEQNLGTYLSIVGMTAEMIDPYCGPILAENFDNIVGRWSKVIAHYPKAAELFMDGKGGVIFTWIGALQATWPVLYAIYQHHLAKTIMIAPNGRIYNKREMPNQNGQMPDPLQPEFQYSAT